MTAGRMGLSGGTAGTVTDGGRMGQGRDAEIGEAARRARKALLLGQEQVAEAAGISVSSVARLERGDGVSDETLKAVCAVIGLDAVGLRRGGGADGAAALPEPGPTRSPATAAESPAARRWFRPGWRRLAWLACAWTLAAIPLSLLGIEIGVDAAAPRGQVMKDGLQDFMEQVVVQRRAGEVNKASAAYSALLPADAPDRGWAPWKQAKSYRWLSCVNLHSGIYPAVVNRDLTYLGGIPECRDRDIPSLVVRHDDEATEFVVGPLPGPLARRLLSLLTGDRSVSVLAIAGDSPELPGPEPDWVDPRRGGGPVPPDGDGYVRIRVGRAR